MKLNYLKDPQDNAGTAVLGCGTIHQSEIKETLNHLTSDLGLTVNLNDYTLGSTGKRTYSGDIDVVLDKVVPNYFAVTLREKFGDENVARNGSMVHLRYPISNYDPTLDELQPRTGYVQVDFNFGNADWERLYHFSPGDKSAYKGAHRNLAIAAITSAVNASKSDIVDTYNRPICIIKWKWGPKGFFRIIRESRRDRNSNVWMKKQEDSPIVGPIYDPEVIALKLFPDDGTPKDLECLETIMEAVKRNFGMVDQERIWKKIAENFSDWKQGKEFRYPPEIEEYFPREDK
jgi:hypothetical protein